MSANHGYGPYSRGCRCEVCRKAKADYMRARRADARRNARDLVPGIKHGLSGYDERGCRCRDCKAAAYAGKNGPANRRRLQAAQ